MIVDESVHYGSQAYTLTRIHHLDGHVLQVKVVRDFYEFQSHATVAVLNAELTWTVLASAPPCDWHHRTTSQATDARRLVPVADQLLRRGRRILTAVPATPPIRPIPPGKEN